eukprot:28663-Amphidinium_carterae.1
MQHPQVFQPMSANQAKEKSAMRWSDAVGIIRFGLSPTTTIAERMSQWLVQDPPHQIHQAAQ